MVVPTLVLSVLALQSCGFRSEDAKDASVCTVTACKDKDKKDTCTTEKLYENSCGKSFGQNVEDVSKEFDWVVGNPEEHTNSKEEDTNSKVYVCRRDIKLNTSVKTDKGCIGYIKVQKNEAEESGNYSSKGSEKLKPTENEQGEHEYDIPSGYETFRVFFRA